MTEAVAHVGAAPLRFGRVRGVFEVEVRSVTGSRATVSIDVCEDEGCGYDAGFVSSFER
jgi:hypothetical protein